METRTQQPRPAPTPPPFDGKAGTPAERAASPLGHEGELFARYLLGGPTVPAVLARYVRACDLLFDDPAAPADAALVRFAVRHPWSLPFLDAAAGLLHRQALLRSKILLMLGLLEATPEHAEFFTPQPCSRLLVIARLGWWGVRTVVKVLGGLLLYPLAKRAQ